MAVLSVHAQQKIFTLIALCAGFFMLFAAQVFAADVVVSPSTGSYGTGQTFTVTVEADPKGDTINAVEATMTFDTSVLSVVSVNKNGSVFSLWTTEPTFSNTAGTIEFGGGSPTPFSSKSTLVNVVFRTVSEGTGSLDFRSASALAADGLGTDVLGETVTGNYTVTAAAVLPPPEEVPAETPAEEPADDDVTIAFGDPPRAPEVGSVTFLDPELWYATSTGVFAWEIPFDVSEIAVDVATSSSAEPVTTYDPPIEEIRLTSEDLKDGIQYLSVQFRNQVGWGAITNRQIKIDTRAPEPFEIEVRPGSTPSAFPLLVFEARDGTSGIDHYELSIADNEPIEVTPEEAKLGYLLGELVDGTYTVTVIAHDKAGNMTESATPVLITAGWLPPVEEEEGSLLLALLTFTNILITLQFAAIFGLLGYMFYDRKRAARRETKLRKETKEIQDQMEKIFSALRDEIYDQINLITKKPRLSKKEREAVEGLNSALEVSETLIEKEIADVQKILK